MFVPIQALVGSAVILMSLAGVQGATSRESASNSPELPQTSDGRREEPFMRRPFRPYSGDRWIGAGIAYGPYRDGQHPGGPSPSQAELREDLLLMSRHWHLLRLYGALGPTPTILETIRQEGLDMKVMLGVWIEAEDRRDEQGTALEHFPEKTEANRREIDSAVRLAAEYPEVVLAVSVGNETQVSWSSHRCPPDLLIRYLREMRSRIPLPVTTADDFGYWSKPESKKVAEEVDFVVTHLHPMWNGIQLTDALEWLRKRLSDVQATHPDQPLVVGETGWATQKHQEGEQAQLIKGMPGEEQQREFYNSVMAWAGQAQIPTFFFQAFDENWKGGEHPDEVEKHWGLFRADRTPKRALVDAR